MGEDWPALLWLIQVLSHGLDSLQDCASAGGVPENYPAPQNDPGNWSVDCHGRSKEDYDIVRKRRSAVQKQARITSKGQITVPRDIRRALGVRPGDRLLFEVEEGGVRVRPVRSADPFKKYQGIGNPGIPSGRKAILRYVRDMRGR